MGQKKAFTLGAVSSKTVSPTDIAFCVLSFSEMHEQVYGYHVGFKLGQVGGFKHLQEQVFGSQVGKATEQLLSDYWQ